MDISIIGSGNMATGIGTRLAGTGHSLSIYDRDEAKARSLAERLGNNTQAKKLESTLEGDVIIFALPYKAIPEVIQALGDSLRGKVVVDISNPVSYGTYELIPPAGTSGIQEIAKILPDTAKPVKAFNTVFAGTLLEGAIKGQKLDVFIAGDDGDAKEAVKQIIEDAGMRCVDAGSLSHARHLEGIQLIHMAAQQQLGSNWMSTIKILQ